MSICGVCHQICDLGATDSFVKCAGVCEKVFHSRCIRTDVEGKKTRSNKEWKCKDCRNTSSTSSATSSSTAITKDFFVTMMEDFKKQIFKELKVFQSEITGLTTSVQFISDKLDSANEFMNKINSEITAVKEENEKLKENNATLTSEVGVLKDRVRSLEQYTRKNNIEISGIPTTPNEQMNKLIKDVGTAVGLEIHDSQISAAHRIPSFKKDRPHSIIVQFTARSTKEAFLFKFREKKVLTANQINVSFPHQRVYINEHLSPDNKVFLAALKRKCKDISYTYVWCRDGKFFVRKRAGDRCKKINNYEDLSALK